MSLFSSNEEHFCTPFALHTKNNLRLSDSRLEPEKEFGNVEYKLRLTDPTPERIERLVTQLKWRIREGHGEAILFLGVRDNGVLAGLSSEEIKLSLQTLEQMSSKIGANMTIVNERIVEMNESEDSNHDSQTSVREKALRNRQSGEPQKENARYAHSLESEFHDKHVGRKIQGRGKRKLSVKKVIQVLIKRKTYDITEELKVAVLGPTESGKSSLLGVLSHEEYDNGRGSARLNLFRHRHEVRSGHTSSISHEVFGFDSHGKPKTYNTCLSMEEIIESSSKVVTLIDLAGHKRYLSTTLFGLGSYSPDLLLLVVGVKTPINSTTAYHISLALGMDKPLAIVINKIDLASEKEQDMCYCEMVKILHNAHPEVIPFRISRLSDAIKAGTELGDSNNVPIFFTSCVAGSGLDLLYRFFNETSPILNTVALGEAIELTSEYQVDKTFDVPGIGTVVSGLVTGGIIEEGDVMLVGPDDEGHFHIVSIVSLQRHKIPCNYARAGQKCTIAILTHDIEVRRGMVIKEMDQDWQSKFSTCLQFEAKISFITDKQHKLGSGHQVSIYVGNVRQTCNVISISPIVDGSWNVNLKLTKRPEYIRVGSRLFVRHTHTNAIGTITRIHKLLN